MNKANLLLLPFLAVLAHAQYKAVNPQVQKMVDQVSEERIADILKKLEGFGSRNIYSAQDDPVRGIGAARKWILEQFKSYSPNLQVSFDHYKLKKSTTPGSRITDDVDLYNVLAVLPGTVHPEQRIIIGGHYDSVVMGSGRPTGAAEGAGAAASARPASAEGQRTPPARRDPNADAPGVTDDGSGTACAMELARVLSQYQFKRPWSLLPSPARRRSAGEHPPSGEGP